MRVYIIANDGIILCREPPAAVNEGEIVVASNEELHAAQLSGKRLLALWNALPDVEKRKKVGDRDALIDQLWSAVEALPDRDQQSDTKPPSKQEAVVAMLQRSEGATVGEVMTRKPRTLGPEALAVEAVHLMEAHKISQLLVVDEHGALLGALNMHDLFRAKVI